MAESDGAVNADAHEANADDEGQRGTAAVRSSSIVGSTAVTTTPLPTPIRGKSDWREYRAVRLENGVTVCVASDRESKTTAVSATVNAGAAHDPRELPGLAHFLEHMCFLGSAKYPGENEYKKYLSQHGGQSNASTSLFLTTYKFEILARHADHAVDVFSQFFVDPLLTASGTGREVNAVDSENSKNLTADVRRRLQVLKDACRKDHYFSKFTTGNVNTLLHGKFFGDDDGGGGSEDPQAKVDRLRQALLAFHAKHYTPDRLTVVAVGPQSIDELLAMVVPRFAAMRPRTPAADVDPTLRAMMEAAANDPPPYEHPRPTVPFENPIPPANLGTILVTRPVKSQRRLVLMFPLPPVMDSDRSPVSVLSHLLGHEGPHSSFAVLQDRGWITSLSAGPRTSSPDFVLFQVDLQLTPEGEASWKDVAAVVLQHARLIHEHADQLAGQQPQHEHPDIAESRLQQIWDESATLSRMFFDQTSPGSAYDFAPSLCQRIVSEGTERALSAGRMLNEAVETFPAELFADFASRITVDNCLMERCSEDAWNEIERSQASIGGREATDGGAPVDGISFQRKTEAWYGVEYFRGTLDPDDVKGWTEPSYKFFDATGSLSLPRPNRYIPRSLELCPDLPREATLGPRIDKPIDPPTLLVSNPFGRLWHRLDDRYALPKSVITILVRNAAVENVGYGNDPATGAIVWRHDDAAAVLSSILAGMYNQAQAQETYDADLAGLHWNLSLGSSGISISCSGFSDRLPDLALKLVQDFCTGDFLQESHFRSTRDRVVRGLKSFLESRRADSDATYYRDLLFSSRGLGIDESLQAAEAASLEAVKTHHKALLMNAEAYTECLFTGNVSQGDARNLFVSLSSTIGSSRGSTPRATRGVWIPGNSERRLLPGQEVELHFSSRNPQEENGAVLVTYQSPVPGYCGDELSSRESLDSTAAIRLICHMLREPLFDELRTKQTLGYVVSSYYDVSCSTRSQEHASMGPLRVPIDFLVINVLSRKLPPQDICQRIDSFLEQFRESLLHMPESQIQHHASALSTKLLKPIQKLPAEAQTHFAKISRYAPELLDNRIGHAQDGGALPWRSVESLAGAISRLRREDLIRTWDGLVLPHNRGRVVSYVYGSTFPLNVDDAAVQRRSIFSRRKLQFVNDVQQLVSSRSLFPVVMDKSSSRSPSHPNALVRRIVSVAPTFDAFPPGGLKVATAMIVGAGLTAAGWTLFQSWRKSHK